MKQQLQKVQNVSAGIILNKYANINDVLNTKWVPIEERTEQSRAIMGFKVIFDENVPNHLKSRQNLASTCNFRSNNKGILMTANQQSKTFEKQAADIFNKLPTNVRSVEPLSVFKTKIKNHFLHQALARSFKD